jgi:hypothetical protein
MVPGENRFRKRGGTAMVDLLSSMDDTFPWIVKETPYPIWKDNTDIDS